MRTAERAPTGSREPVLACQDAQCRELMMRYQAGEAEAFTALYAQLSPQLLEYLDTLAPALGAGARLLDDVFAAIHDARRSYSPRRSFNAWLTAIVQHVVGTRRPSPSPIARLERLLRRGRGGSARHAPANGGTVPRASCRTIRGRR